MWNSQGPQAGKAALLPWKASPSLANRKQPPAPPQEHLSPRASHLPLAQQLLCLERRPSDLLLLTPGSLLKHHLPDALSGHPGHSSTWSHPGCPAPRLACPRNCTHMSVPAAHAGWTRAGAPEACCSPTARTGASGVPRRHQPGKASWRWRSRSTPGSTSRMVTLWTGAVITGVLTGGLCGCGHKAGQPPLETGTQKLRWA